MISRNQKGTLEILKSKWWKILIIAFLASLIFTLMHAILPTGESVLEPSVIVLMGLLPLAFLIYCWIYYSLLGCIFVLIEERFKGSKRIKGFIYGLFFCILTFLIYLEPLSNTATLSYTNLVWMLADGVQYIILGVLLGQFLAKDSTKDENIESAPKKWLLLVIPLIFLVGRLISYNVFHIYSNFQISPLTTVTWVLAVGVGIGVLYYYLLRPAVKADSPFSTALLFGITFGIYLFMLNFAYALIVSFTLQTYLDFFIRTGMDVLSASIGVYAYEYLLNKYQEGIED